MFGLLHVVAILSVALYLLPGGAHLFEMPNKMSLDPGHYMIVQQIYSGCALFGVALAFAVAMTLAHAIAVRADRRALSLSALALVALFATQVIFWTFTYPMNVVTHDWTVEPERFEAARRQWEFSHAASALLTFMALIFVTMSALRYRGALARIDRSRVPRHGDGPVLNRRREISP